MENKDFTIAELFEEAKKDSSWEEDEQERVRLCEMLKIKLREIS